MQLAPIDRDAARNLPGDRAEADGDPVRPAVDIAGQGLGEHFGIEFEGLAIRIDIGARIDGLEKRRAERGSEAENLVDIAVFRQPQHTLVEPALGEQFVGVI